MKNLTIPINEQTKFHICVNESSAETYTDAYPRSLDGLQGCLHDLLDQEAYHDDDEIEIYVKTKIRIKTTKTVEIIQE